METENAILVWNHVSVSLGYKYDLSIIVDDVTGMLERLLTEASGHQTVVFGSDTFLSTWMLTWQEGSLRVSADWESTTGNAERALTEAGAVETTVLEFVSEWKSVLRIAIEAIQKSGVAIEDQEEWAQLLRVEAAIPAFGRLYQRQPEPCATLDDGGGTR